jgi:hypothetical protein
VGEHRRGYVDEDTAIKRARLGGYIGGCLTTIAVWSLALWGADLWTWLWMR